MTLFTSEYYCGFGTDCNFGIIWGGYDAVGMSGWSQQAYGDTNHIPGSDTNETFLMGHGPLTITYRLLFNSITEYQTFLAYRQTQDTLTVFAAMCELSVPEVNLFGTAYKQIPNVTLMSTSSVVVIGDGTVEVDATFQLQERP